MPTNLLRSLAHARQPKVPGSMRGQGARVDALAIVTHAQLKLAGVVADLHFNPTGAGVPERIAQRLAADPIDVVADDRAEGVRRPLRESLSNTDVSGGADEFGPFVRVAFDLQRGAFAAKLVAFSAAPPIFSSTVMRLAP